MPHGIYERKHNDAKSMKKAIVSNMGYNTAHEVINSLAFCGVNNLDQLKEASLDSLKPHMTERAHKALVRFKLEKLVQRVPKRNKKVADTPAQNLEPLSPSTQINDLINYIPDRRVGRTVIGALRDLGINKLEAIKDLDADTIKRNITRKGYESLSQLDLISAEIVGKLDYDTPYKLPKKQSPIKLNPSAEAFDEVKRNVPAKSLEEKATSSDLPSTNESPKSYLKETKEKTQPTNLERRLPRNNIASLVRLMDNPNIANAAVKFLQGRDIYSLDALKEADLFAFKEFMPTKLYEALVEFKSNKLPTLTPKQLEASVKQPVQAVIVKPKNVEVKKDSAPEDKVRAMSPVVYDISKPIPNPTPSNQTIKSPADDSLERLRAYEGLKNRQAGEVSIYLPRADKKVLQAFIAGKGLENMAQLYDKLRSTYKDDRKGLPQKIVNFALYAIETNYFQHAQTNLPKQVEISDSEEKEIEKRGFTVTISNDRLGVDIDGQRAFTTTYPFNHASRERHLNLVAETYRLYSLGLNPDAISDKTKTTLQYTKSLLVKGGIMNYSTPKLPIASGNISEKLKRIVSSAPPQSLFEGRP